MSVKLLQGDCRDVLPTLPSGSVHLVMTSPPYYRLRRYLDPNDPAASKEIGNEMIIGSYVNELVLVFRAIRRVLRDDGLLVVNIGDSYVSSSTYNAPQSMHTEAGWKQPGKSPNAGRFDGKPKDLIGVPWRVAFALRDDGWYWRSCLPWVKRSLMPESVVDRPTNAIEYVMLFSKQARYYWDAEAVRREAAYGGEQLGIVRGKKRRAEAMGVTPSGNERLGADATIPSARNFRNSDLFYDSLEPPFGLICDAGGEPLALDVNPEPTKLPHFAAYPSKLVVPFVKAGTSERGVCAACGAAWVRQIQTDYAPTSRTPPPNKGRIGALGERSANMTRDGFIPNREKVRQTISWLPSCTCNAGDPVPATVLDPFGGIQTTAMVADRLGRNAIGIELSQAYIDLAWDRIQAEHPHERVKPTPDDHSKAGPLFGEIAAQ